MKRRTFTKIGALAAIASSLPITAFANTPQIPTQELVGKGNPTFIKKGGYILRKEAALSFDQMKAAAASQGIDLKVVSSYRSYAHQNSIWERKYKRFNKSGLSPAASISKIIEYSTMPGTSRHHWGTDLDIIDGTPAVTGDVLVSSKFHGIGPFCAMKEWMDTHAATYNFYLVYTDTLGRKGFNYEPWHYSYAPLAIGYLEAYKKLDLGSVLANEALLGSAYFENDFLSKYREENILDINPRLLP